MTQEALLEAVLIAKRRSRLSQKIARFRVAATISLLLAICWLGGEVWLMHLSTVSAASSNTQLTFVLEAFSSVFTISLALAVTASTTTTFILLLRVVKLLKAR